jgi:hypothetical protein
MDRDEALKLLKGGPNGVKEWNRRRESGEKIPDLSKAIFTGANLTRADLTDADLCGAYLTLADLALANLTGANLGEGNLGRANLYRTHLDGANLRGASCFRTVFADVDLSEAEGLATIKHDGPSTIGTDTLLKSRGRIPEAFLRGCGVPDSLIQSLPLILNAMQPIQFYSCFISHSSKDQAFADRLHSRMVQERLRVWYAPEDMRGGRKNVDQIDQAIQVHDKLLLALSKASMQSDWVKHEITRAVEREKMENRQVLFPIALVSRKAIKDWSAFDSDSGKDLAKVVREYHIPDFSKWKDDDAFEKAFSELLRDLRPDDSSAAATARQTPH